MKTIEIPNPSPELADLIRDASKDSIIITRDGEPVAMVLGVHGTHPLEMEPPEEFYKMIQQRRANGKLVPWEEAKARLLGASSSGKQTTDESSRKE
jgi:antitoxin (DNA-binding transcriptional repressor) of toxin-antitoxin stability system